ncbi:YgaP family membrane protein [Pseudomonas fluvialis]|uniref:YgaP family membrane protein n=1 Tax=Pseudomonas fluvialis TaxID=1793966 RepID=UPI0035B331B0
MKANVGTLDRALRIAAGLLLLGLTLAGFIGVWGWIGLLPLATGLFRFCPAYPLLGISTCGRADSCCGKDSCKK